MNCLPRSVDNYTENPIATQHPPLEFVVCRYLLLYEDGDVRLRCLADPEEKLPSGAAVTASEVDTMMVRATRIGQQEM